MHLPEGTILQNGRYRIVRFIKSGGFGCTYEGELSAIGAKVAIKEFFPSDFCNRESDNTVSVGTKSKEEEFIKLKRSFMKEASVLFKMQNTHIVRVTDVFEENGTAYYVMDYIDGPSLADIIKQKGKLSESEALGYIHQVCEALKYVHSQNRMHMDIKPGNIMVDRNGKAILIDFGASKYYDEQTGEQTSTNVGTYTNGYAPIEQVSRTLKNFNPATDIYALGATLYKLLTGVTPPNSMALVTDAETLKPLPLTISEPTRKAVESAMQLKDKQRPQSVEEFERILKKGVVNPDDEKTQLDHHTERKDEKESSKSKKVFLIQSNNEESKEGSNHNQNVNNPKIEPQYPSVKNNEESVQNKVVNNSSKTKILIGASAVIVLIIICFFAFRDKSGSNETDENSIVEVEAQDVLIEAASHEEDNNALKDPYNGHEYVDLGLPSGLKWATCNVGANSPEEYGDYFAWGETKTKLSYDKNNSETYEKNIQWLRDNGYIGDKGNINLEHDAAHQNWGGSWRMPTRKEMKELENHTTVEQTKLNGVKGLLVKSKKNGNSIFLPNAGYRQGASLINEGIEFDYWRLTPLENYSFGSYVLGFSFNDFGLFWGYSYLGFSVRPVTE